MPKINLFQTLSKPRARLQGDSVETTGATALHTFVHPCVIDERPYIIYPKGLEQQSPLLFHRLCQYFSQQGYALKEDRRSAASDRRYRKERRRWVPVLLVSANLFLSTVAAEPVQLSDAASSETKQEIRLQLIYNQDIHHHASPDINPLDSGEYTLPTRVKPGIASRLYGILQQHYQPRESDPAYTIDDLRQIANYYSEFPEVITLLEELDDKEWRLSYDENDWYTTASGSMVQVNSATIHFNSRSAAQLRLNNGCINSPVCIASPADALLHELLHTHSMLVKTKEFIAQGGMSHHLYPYKHEYSIIDSERRLYSSMSRQDAVRRPQRREHSGRLIRARCPTCID